MVVEQTIEKWAAPPGFSRYLVSDHGRVLGVHRHGKSRPVLSGVTRSDGYVQFCLRSDAGEKLRVLGHVLTLTTFVGPRPKGHDGRHLNGEPGDNRVENLAWGTRKENCQDTVRHGRTTRGRTANSILNEAAVREIRTRKTSVAELARRFGCAKGTIYSVLYRHSWAWVR